MSNVLEITKNFKEKANLLASYNAAETIREISEIPYIAGTFRIVPILWSQHIRLNGKKDSNAIDLLAEIVSWYRSRIKEDEESGELIGYSKAFKAHMFQCSMLDLSVRVGITKNQTIPAIHRLEKAGLIIRDIRDIQLKNGRVANNVQFLAPIASAIRAITIKKFGLATEKNNDINDYLDFTPIASNDVESSEPLPNLNWGGGKTTKKSYNQHATLPNSNWGDSSTENCKTPQSELGTNTEILTEILTAAEAIEKTVPLQPLKNSPNFAAAANFSHVKKENDFTVPTVPTSPIGNIQREAKDSIISESLSDYQKAYVLKKIEQLPSAHYLPSLSDEIMAGVLDKQCFVNCGIDFHRKVNAMIQTVVKGTWSAPISMYQDSLQKNEVTKKEVNAELNKLKEVYNEAFHQYTHWGKLVKFHESSETTALSIEGRKNALIIQLKVWEDLKKAGSDLNDFMPNIPLPLLPNKPILDELNAGEMI